jgi:hypothetical protein
VIFVDKKIKISIITILIIISGFMIYEIASGNLLSYAFDEIGYNYTGFVSIPNETTNGGSLGGNYNINGKGQKFTFNVNLRGAQNFEDPLCYTSSGLTGNGTIDTINVTSNTIKDLLNHNFKSAMFQTPMTGHFDMKCAAWTGYSNFSNNGTDFIGYFKINGVDTDFQGTYKFVPDGNQIAVITSYVYNFVGETNTTQVNRTYYM